MTRTVATIEEELAETREELAAVEADVIQLEALVLELEDELRQAKDAAVYERAAEQGYTLLPETIEQARARAERDNGPERLLEVGGGWIHCLYGEPDADGNTAEAAWERHGDLPVWRSVDPFSSPRCATAYDTWAARQVASGQPLENLLAEVAPHVGPEQLRAYGRPACRDQLVARVVAIRERTNTEEEAPVSPPPIPLPGSPPRLHVAGTVSADPPPPVGASDTPGGGGALQQPTPEQAERVHQAGEAVARRTLEEAKARLEAEHRRGPMSLWARLEQHLERTARPVGCASCGVVIPAGEVAFTRDGVWAHMLCLRSELQREKALRRPEALCEAERALEHVYKARHNPERLNERGEAVGDPACFLCGLAIRRGDDVRTSPGKSKRHHAQCVEDTKALHEEQGATTCPTSTR